MFEQVVALGEGFGVGVGDGGGEGIGRGCWEGRGHGEKGGGVGEERGCSFRESCGDVDKGGLINKGVVGDCVIKIIQVMYNVFILIAFILFRMRINRPKKCSM